MAKRELCYVLIPGFGVSVYGEPMLCSDEPGNVHWRVVPADAANMLMRAACTLRRVLYRRDANPMRSEAWREASRRMYAFLARTAEAKAA